MKRIFMIFVLLFVKSMQSSLIPIEHQKKLEKECIDIYKTAIMRAIENCEEEKCIQALNNRKKEITSNFNVYNTALTTLSKNQKLKNLAQLKTKSVFEQENYKRIVELKKNMLMIENQTTQEAHTNKVRIETFSRIQKQIDKYDFLENCDKEVLKKAEEFVREQGELEHELIQSKIFYFRNLAQLSLTELSMKSDLMKAELESLKAATECNEKAAIWYETNSSGNNVTEYQEVIESEEEQEESEGAELSEREPVVNGMNHAFSSMENGIN